jgi:hypothetical protein
MCVRVLHPEVLAPPPDASPGGKPVGVARRAWRESVETVGVGAFCVPAHWVGDPAAAARIETPDLILESLMRIAQCRMCAQNRRLLGLRLLSRVESTMTVDARRGAEGSAVH